MISLALVPLLLGTAEFGTVMYRLQQTAQLAREAGYLYARGTDFSQPGNQTILATVGLPLGLSTTAGSGSAEVILSQLTYVDKYECAEAGAVDATGNPKNCTNFGNWVFAQRLTIGNSTVLPGSNLGSPLTTGPAGVAINPVTGSIPQSDYVLKAGAVVRFNSLNPYGNINGQFTSLPSHQFLYVAEAGASALVIRPFQNAKWIYSYGIF
jgi:hypothetical protein